MPQTLRRRGHNPLPTGTRSGSHTRPARGIVSLIASLLAPVGAPATAVTMMVVAIGVGLQIPGRACAGVVTVPDDSPSVQAAIDLGADTVLIRTGEYPEIPSVPRGVVILGLGIPRPHLAGLAISNPNGQLSWTWRVQDIDFAGPVSIRTPNYQNRLLDISFVRCRLVGGIQHDQATSSDPYDIMDFRLLACQLGAASIGRSARLVMHADTIDAGISWGVVEHVSVDSCWFRGGSREALQVWGDVGIAQIDNNVFENAGKGLAIVNGEQVAIHSNVVRHMTGTGIEVWGKFGVLDSNSIQDCGTGLWSACDGVSLVRNSVVRIRDMAAYFLVPESIVAEQNVIGDCGSDAIFVQSPSQADITFRQNTLYRAGRSGLVIADGGDNTLTLEDNLIFGSGTFGLYVATTFRSDTLRCNDWYANSADPVTGMPMSPSDFTLDPLFCDISQGDAHLSAGSPLLNAGGCGLVGALGQGCDAPMACRLATFTATSATDGVEVRWQVADAAPGFVAWIERAEAVGGPWARVESQRTSDGDVTVEYDRTTAPARSYWYRLVATDRGLTRALGEPIQVETAPPTRFALLGTGPNPSPGAVEATFQLPHAAEITLELFDAQGRRVATLARGSWPAGVHRANWAGAQPASGLYLVRYRHPGGEDLRRIAIVR